MGGRTNKEVEVINQKGRPERWIVERRVDREGD